MDQTTDDIRYEMRDRREQLGQKADALRDEVRERVSEARQALDVGRYIRDYPWVAVGLAIGAGVALGRSGADARLATATADGVRDAGTAVRDAAVGLKERAMDLVHRDDGPADLAESPSRQGESPTRSRLALAIDEFVREGLADFNSSFYRAG
jgi:hypothetical protein